MLSSCKQIFRSCCHSWYLPSLSRVRKRCHLTLRHPLMI
uniref:FAT domain-containing protein / phosphatidylinositol 3-and 4-kinase family protein n=1 Tax=Arundo donax TaxID=35708 RepID=A0A0A9FAJ8_ARUDO